MSIPYAAGEPLTVQQIRELDVLAIEHVGIPGVVLMENAGRRAAELIYASLLNPDADRAVVLCGAGNNGGDGFVAARHLHNAGVPVCLILAQAAQRCSGDAAVNLGVVERMGLRIIDASGRAGLDAAAAEIGGAAVIIDALLGTGSSGAPRGPMAELIERSNAAEGARRVAIDLPSGFDADAGVAHAPCFRADATITMVAPKPGFESKAGRRVCGRVVAVDIGVPRELIPGRSARPGGENAAGT